MDGHAEDARGAKYKKKSEPILVDKSQQSEFAVCSEIWMPTVFLFSADAIQLPTRREKMAVAADQAGGRSQLDEETLNTAKDTKKPGTSSRSEHANASSRGEEGGGEDEDSRSSSSGSDRRRREKRRRARKNRH